jgi:hypothetical protein
MGELEKQRLEQLLGPTGFEVTCDECFEQLDGYVELELTGSDPDQRFPGLRTHLEGCPACREDHESLLAFVKGEDAS